MEKIGRGKLSAVEQGAAIKNWCNTMPGHLNGPEYWGGSGEESWELSKSSLKLQKNGMCERHFEQGYQDVKGTPQ